MNSVRTHDVRSRQPDKSSYCDLCGSGYVDIQSSKRCSPKKNRVPPNPPVNARVLKRCIVSSVQHVSSVNGPHWAATRAGGGGGDDLNHVLLSAPGRLHSGSIPRRVLRSSPSVCHHNSTLLFVWYSIRQTTIPGYVLLVILEQGRSSSMAARSRRLRRADFRAAAAARQLARLHPRRVRHPGAHTLAAAAPPTA